MTGRSAARLAAIALFAGLLVGLFGPAWIRRKLEGPPDPSAPLSIPRGWARLKPGRISSRNEPGPLPARPVIRLAGRLESTPQAAGEGRPESPCITPENLGGECRPVIVQSGDELLARMELTVWADTPTGRVTRGPLFLDAAPEDLLDGSHPTAPPPAGILTGEVDRARLTPRALPFRVETRLLLAGPTPAVRAGATFYGRGRLGIALDAERDSGGNLTVAAGVGFSWGRR